MQYGAHLPLIDFEKNGWRSGSLVSYARAARQLGYEWLTVNDHLIFQRPWLDGIVALSSVIEASGGLGLATSIVLPVVRGPAVVAKAAAALDILSGGRLALGVGPGSSPRDYGLVGLPFEERWPRFERSVRALRAHMASDGPASGGPESEDQALAPRPGRSVPIWIASWGSDAGLRRVARLGDGWLASAYNTDPDQLRAALAKLDAAPNGARRGTGRVPCALATMWTFVTDDGRARQARLNELAAMLNRPAAHLVGRVLVGTAEHCAEVVRAYADAGADRLFIWPLGDDERQLERFMLEVVPATGLRSAENSSRPEGSMPSPSRQAPGSPPPRGRG